MYKFSLLLAQTHYCNDYDTEVTSYWSLMRNSSFSTKSTNFHAQLSTYTSKNIKQKMFRHLTSSISTFLYFYQFWFCMFAARRKNKAAAQRNLRSMQRDGVRGRGAHGFMDHYGNEGGFYGCY